MLASRDYVTGGRWSLLSLQRGNKQCRQQIEILHKKMQIHGVPREQGELCRGMFCSFPAPPTHRQLSLMLINGPRRCNQTTFKSGWKKEGKVQQPAVPEVWDVDFNLVWTKLFVLTVDQMTTLDVKRFIRIHVESSPDPLSSLLYVVFFCDHLASFNIF